MSQEFHTYVYDQQEKKTGLYKSFPANTHGGFVHTCPKLTMPALTFISEWMHNVVQTTELPKGTLKKKQ
jgi:hypothetical protein